MKICWDNLEKLEYLTGKGEWRDKSHYFIYKDVCENCREPFLGRKYQNSEFCDRSCSKSGKNHPLYGKNSGKNNPFYGKNHSKETKHKISIAVSGIMSGENHPNWKGGISCEPYCDVWLDKDFKESIKERDGYQCLNPVCSRESKKLCVHHINYIKKDCNPFNLITVCKSCNTKANSDRVWHEAWYNILIYNRRKR